MDSLRAGITEAAPNTTFADAFLHGGKPCFSGPATASFGTRTPGRVAGSGQGIFARWHWDGTALTAEVDRYGFFSLFYSVDGDRVRISPSLLQLAAIGCELTPDHRALAVFHRLGIFINEDTPFEGIKVLPPGGTLTWRNGTVSIEAPKREIKTLAISREDAIDGFIDLFRKSIARTIDAWDGPIISPLSGGRDSRHIMMELAHQGRKPDACITFQHGGDRWNAEVKAARAICEAAGVRHDVLGHVRSRLADGIRAIALTELCADEHAQMMPLHDYYLDHPAASYDGIAGDVLSGDVLDRGAEADKHCIRLARDGKFSEIARIFVDGHSKVISGTSGPRAAGGHFSPDRDQEALDYIAQTVAKYADTPDPIQNFFLMNRTRREIGFVARGILSSAGAAFCPYLDEDLVEFCLSLPYETTDMREKTFHDEVTDKAYPAFSDVPFEEGFQSDPPRRSPIRHKLSSIADMARVARFMAPAGMPLGELKVLLGRGGPLSPGPNEILHIHNRLVESLSPKRARAILAFAADLEESRPKNLMSNSFIPPDGT